MNGRIKQVLPEMPLPSPGHHHRVIGARTGDVRARHGIGGIRCHVYHLIGGIPNFDHRTEAARKRQANAQQNRFTGLHRAEIEIVLVHVAALAVHDCSRDGARALIACGRQSEPVRAGNRVVRIFRVGLKLDRAGQIHPQLVVTHTGAGSDPRIVSAAGGNGVTTEKNLLVGPAIAVGSQISTRRAVQFQIRIQPAVRRIHTD